MPVYIVRAIGTDRYKIGYARDGEKRRWQLERGATGQRLELVMTIACNRGGEHTDTVAVVGTPYSLGNCGLFPGNHGVP